MRFDNQLKAMEGAGIAPVTEPKRALEFLSKLDTRRYGRMLSQMRNDALRAVPDAFARTLASAFRIASGWTNPEYSTSTQAKVDLDIQVGAAFVTKTGSESTTKAPKSTRKATSTAGNRFVCGKSGHIARDCEN